MASFLPGLPGLKSQVVDGMKLQLEDGKTSIIQIANNNRKKGVPLKSSKALGSNTTLTIRGSSQVSSFNALDSAITAMDATFNSQADQEAWIEYAHNIAGDWQLCANCETDKAAQQLFRQYNLNRQAIGEPVVLTPVDNTETALSGGDFFFVLIGRDGDDMTVFLSLPGGVGGEYWQPSLGAGLGNPIWLIDAAQLGTQLTGGSGYAFALSIASVLGVDLDQPGSFAATFASCFWTQNGAPGLRSTGEFELSAK